MTKRGIRYGKYIAVAHKMVNPGKKTCSLWPHNALIGLDELCCVGVGLKQRQRGSEK